MLSDAGAMSQTILSLSIFSVVEAWQGDLAHIDQCITPTNTCIVSTWFAGEAWWDFCFHNSLQINAVWPARYVSMVKKLNISYPVYDPTKVWCYIIIRLKK